MKIQNYFNMVEIVLALAVVSIAIVSLMGVLPVALKASKNSVADNSVAMVADVMKRFIDTQYDSLKNYNPPPLPENPTPEQQADPRYKYKKFYDDFARNFENSKPAAAQQQAHKNQYKKEHRELNDSLMERFAFQITREDSNNGVYLVELFSGEWDEKASANDKDGEFAVTDFAAEVRVWRQTLDAIYIPYYHYLCSIGDDRFNRGDFERNVFEGNLSDTDDRNYPDNAGCTVFVEISWPAGAAYPNQEHRLYQYNYFAW